MSIDSILAFINNNKISLLLTFLTSLPAVYFIIGELGAKPPLVSGDITFDMAAIFSGWLAVISIPLCAWAVFYFFNIGLTWLSIIMIIIAPIMYFVCMLIASWIGFVIGLLINLISAIILK